MFFFARRGMLRALTVALAVVTAHGNGFVASEAPPGLISYLLTWEAEDRGSYFTDLRLSLRCLWSNFLSVHDSSGTSRHSVVIFYTGDMPHSAQDLLSRSLPSQERHRLLFRRIEFDFPSIVTDDYMETRCVDPQTGSQRWRGTHDARSACGCTCGERCWPVNYLSMNRWRMLRLWETLRADDELQSRSRGGLMTVDADVFLVRALPFDPFARMRARGCSFMTGTAQRREERGCYEGQKVSTLEWLRAQEPNSTALLGTVTVADAVAAVDGLAEGEMWWGGFNVASSRVFATAAHLDYARYVQERGGVYTRRWNDQGHYPLAAALLTGKTDGACHEDAFDDDEHDGEHLVHMHGYGTDPDAAGAPEWARRSRPALLQLRAWCAWPASSRDADAAVDALRVPSEEL